MTGLSLFLLPELSGSRIALAAMTGGFVAWIVTRIQALGKGHRMTAAILRYCARLPLIALAESVRVAFAALGRTTPEGEMTQIPFDPGGDDPDSAGRRAAVVWGLSLAPNTIVIEIDRPGELFVHRLLPSVDRAGSGGDRKWPL
jgi:hypothetical protein